MLGERICLLRKQARMSQSELAERLRVSPSTIGMYEQGRREPSLAVAVELSRIFEISVDCLLTGKPLTEHDGLILRQTVEQSLAQWERPCRGLSEEELSVLLAAMLTET